jgi:hypothetical protein
MMARYNKFDDSSEHDWGVFIFAGYLSGGLNAEAGTAQAFRPTPPIRTRPSGSSPSTP